MLKRADLVSEIPTYIQFAESRFNRDLRMPQQQQTLTGLVTDGLIQLPSDCREVQSLRLAVGNSFQEIHPLPPEFLADTVPTIGFAKGYVVVRDQVTLIGGSGSPEFALTYWQKIPALGTDMPSNWLLLREPALYLYATLLEAAPVIRDAEMAAVWATQYKSILDAMNAERDGYRYGNGGAMQPPMRLAP